MMTIRNATLKWIYYIYANIYTTYTTNISPESSMFILSSSWIFNRLYTFHPLNQSIRLRMIFVKMHSFNFHFNWLRSYKVYMTILLSRYIVVIVQLYIQVFVVFSFEKKTNIMNSFSFVTLLKPLCGLLFLYGNLAVIMIMLYILLIWLIIGAHCSSLFVKFVNYKAKKVFINSRKGNIITSVDIEVTDIKNIITEEH